MVGLVILFFLWALSVAAQPKKSRIRDSGFRIQEEGAAQPASENRQSQIANDRLSRKRRQSLDRTLSAYRRSLVEERK
jgi:hypothetical protein